MSKSYLIRTYKKGDAHEIIDLLKLTFTVWAKKQKPLDYWEWRYSDSPIKHSIHVAICDDKIVAVNHMSLFNIKIGNLTLPSFYAGDVATSPDYRGLGIYNKIVDTANQFTVENGYKFGYWLTSNPIIIKDGIKRRYQAFPHSITYMARIRDIKLHLENRPASNESMLRIGYSTLYNINKAKNIMTRNTASKTDFSIKDVTSFGHDFDEFNGRLRDNHAFLIDKSHDLLNWRYCDSRGGVFIIRQALEADQVLGFAVLQVTQLDDYVEGYVMELATLPGRSDVASALLTDLCMTCEKMDINAVYYMVPDGHPYQTVSNKHSFINSQRHPNIYCRVYDFTTFELINLSPSERIYFGYAEIFI